MIFEELKAIIVVNASASGTATPDEVETYWFTCILYVAKRLNVRDCPSKKGVSLCRILRAANLNVTYFYKELGQFLIKVGAIFNKSYGADWEKRLKAKESQTNFVHMILLSKTRKVRGALNFDDVDGGLVTDSVVASSLYVPNGNSASSPPLAVKSEQPDF